MHTNKYKHPHYLLTLKKLHHQAINRFYDSQLKIFTDPNLNPEEDLDYHLEMNAWLAWSFISNPKSKPEDQNYVREILRYFSAAEGRLEAYLWDSKDWYFSDRYVPYLMVFQKSNNTKILQ